MLARFTQEDTYFGEMSDPASLNRYVYCVNDPISYEDPSGHSPVYSQYATGAGYANVMRDPKYNKIPITGGNPKYPAYDNQGNKIDYWSDTNIDGENTNNTSQMSGSSGPQNSYQFINRDALIRAEFNQGTIWDLLGKASQRGEGAPTFSGHYGMDQSIPQLKALNDYMQNVYKETNKIPDITMKYPSVVDVASAVLGLYGIIGYGSATVAYSATDGLVKFSAQGLKSFGRDALAGAGVNKLTEPLPDEYQTLAILGLAAFSPKKFKSKGVTNANEIKMLPQGKVGNFTNVKNVHDFINRVPDNAKRLPWKDVPGGAKQGIKYEWVDASGNKFQARAHEMDPSAPLGSNASEGWIYRVQMKYDGKGKWHYMDSAGNFHMENVLRENSPFYNETIANDTHIPFKR